MPSLGPSYRQSDSDGMGVILILIGFTVFVGLLIALFFNPPTDSIKYAPMNEYDYCQTQRFVAAKDLQAQCIKYFVH